MVYALRQRYIEITSKKWPSSVCGVGITKNVDPHCRQAIDTNEIQDQLLGDTHSSAA